jgi:hypothetical protein
MLAGALDDFAYTLAARFLATDHATTPKILKAYV